MVNKTILESKTGKTRERGGGGNVKNLMKKFGQMANEALHETGGDRKSNTIFERAKAVPCCARMSGRLCGKPMAESLQNKDCAEPTRNNLRGDPHKL